MRIMALAATAQRSACELNWMKNSFFFGIKALNIDFPSQLGGYRRDATVIIKSPSLGWPGTSSFHAGV